MTPVPKPKHALVVRAGPYDCTQAVPRTAACLEGLGYEVTILSWDRDGTAHRDTRVGNWEVSWFVTALRPHSLLFFAYWLVWWIWVMRQLLKRRYALVHAMNLESVVPCVLLRRLLGYKLVYDIRDAWGQAVSNRPFPVPQVFRTLGRWGARRTDGLLLSQGLLGRMSTFFGPGISRRVPTVQVLNVPQKDMAGVYLPPPLKGIRLNYSGYISSVRNATAILEPGSAASRRTD